jgi:hypothetical protein
VQLADLIQGNEEFEAVRPLLAAGADLDRKAFFEVNGNILRSRWCSDWVVGACYGQLTSPACLKGAAIVSPSPHVNRRRLGRVFENSRFVRTYGLN